MGPGLWNIAVLMLWCEEINVRLHLVHDSAYLLLVGRGMCTASFSFDAVCEWF